MEGDITNIFKCDSCSFEISSEGDIGIFHIKDLIRNHLRENKLHQISPSIKWTDNPYPENYSEPNTISNE